MLLPTRALKGAWIPPSDTGGGGRFGGEVQDEEEAVSGVGGGGRGEGRGVGRL